MIIDLEPCFTIPLNVTFEMSVRLMVVHSVWLPGKNRKVDPVVKYVAACCVYWFKVRHGCSEIYIVIQLDIINMC